MLTEVKRPTLNVGYSMCWGPRLNTKESMACLCFVTMDVTHSGHRVISTMMDMISLKCEPHPISLPKLLSSGFVYGGQ